MAVKAIATYRPTVGVVGLGLMGRDIAACLLAHGLEVVGFDKVSKHGRDSLPYLRTTLAEMSSRGLLSKEYKKTWKARFRVVPSLEEMRHCEFVIEAAPENLETKNSIFSELETLLSRNAIIASNTSSLPITLLQAERQHPGRFIGMHWAEPAQIMQYLEVIPGRQTTPRTVKLTRALGQLCGKAPTVLQQDIRGFLSNRMMYAMIREAFYLVEAGIADIETVDRSFRNDIGWWATLAGPFRWMDLTGIPAYAAVMDGLLPELSQSTTVPKLMRQVLKKGARGVLNRKGFYRYSKESSEKWQKAWVEFTYDVKKLAEKYQEELA